MFLCHSSIDQIPHQLIPLYSCSLLLTQHTISSSSTSRLLLLLLLAQHPLLLLLLLAHCLLLLLLLQAGHGSCRCPQALWSQLGGSLEVRTTLQQPLNEILDLGMQQGGKRGVPMWQGEGKVGHGRGTGGGKQEGKGGGRSS